MEENKAKDEKIKELEMENFKNKIIDTVEEKLLSDIYKRLDNIDKKISELPTAKDIQFLIDNHTNNCPLKNDIVIKNDFDKFSDNWWTNKVNRKESDLNKFVILLKNIIFLGSTLFTAVVTIYIVLQKTGIIK